MKTYSRGCLDLRGAPRGSERGSSRHSPRSLPRQLVVDVARHFAQSGELLGGGLPPDGDGLEMLLDLQNHLDDIERIQAKVFHQPTIERHFARIYLQLLRYDLLQPQLGRRWCHLVHTN